MTDWPTQRSCDHEATAAGEPSAFLTLAADVQSASDWFSADKQSVWKCDCCGGLLIDGQWYLPV